jgi:hypothetical protein
VGHQCYRNQLVHEGAKAKGKHFGDDFCSPLDEANGSKVGNFLHAILFWQGLIPCMDGWRGCCSITFADSGLQSGPVFVVLLVVIIIVVVVMLFSSRTESSMYRVCYFEINLNTVSGLFRL